MTARGILAALVTIVIFLFAGRYLLSLQGAGPDDFLATLFLRGEHAGFRCFLLAAGAVASAFIAAVSCLAVFQDRDDDLDEDEEFPFGAIPFFLLLGLGLLWFSTGCAGGGVHEDTALDNAINDPHQSVTSTEEPTLSGGVEALAGGAPAELPINIPARIDDPLPTDEMAQAATANIDPLIVAHPINAPAWPYMTPLMRDGRAISYGAANAFLDQVFEAPSRTSALRDALCGKNWVAVIGATSEEGPTARNRARARVRAELAAKRARKWVADTPDCPAPIIIPVSFGQHETTSLSADQSTTAYQRQILFLSGGAAGHNADFAASAAAAEIADFLAAPETLGQLIGDRRYPHGPVIVPDAGS